MFLCLSAWNSIDKTLNDLASKRFFFPLVILGRTVSLRLQGVQSYLGHEDIGQLHS